MKKLRSIIFLLVSFALFILILEIILRTTHVFDARISWSKPDALVGWKSTPGSTYWFNKENDHPISGKINSYGWRDKEWLLEKPRDSFRIAVVGDSFVEALQVEEERVFTSLTERNLNQDRAPRVELLNFGRSGSTQSEQLLILKNEIIKFSPDMVILFFFPGNDISDVSRATAASVMRPFYYASDDGELVLDTSFASTRKFKLKSILNPLKQNSALVSLIAERYNAYREAMDATTRNRITSHEGTSEKHSMFPKNHLSLCTTSPDPQYIDNFKLNKRLIKAMADYSKGHEIDFMLVSINLPTYHPDVDKKYKTGDMTFDTNCIENELRDFAESLDIQFLGLQRIFTEHYATTGDSLLWGENGHWNYLGHEVVAQAFTEKLRPIINAKVTQTR